MMASTALSRIGARIGAALRRVSPAARRVARDNARLREQGLRRLAGFARSDAGPLFERALVDGQWDNANYWIRYALVSRALGLSARDATGIMGQFSRARVEAAFSAFGIGRFADHDAHRRRRGDYMAGARRILAGISAPGDLLSAEFPGGFPAALVYDGLLKRQRRASVDLADPGLPGLLAGALSSIEKADEIVDAARPGIVVMSHALDYTYGAFAWAATRRGIPSLALYGDYGVARFLRMRSPGDIFSYPLRPALAQDSALGGAEAASLERAGAAYLEARLAGRTDDVGAIYAFGRRQGRLSREQLCARFEWDPAKPIVAVYAPNWFDYPHSSDRMPFRDFREWAEQVIAVAKAHDAVNWLFKAHPCDEWYGTIRGARLSDLVAASPVRHCAMADTSWNGTGLLRSIDALTTFHGTAGLEAAFLGMPVLVPYAGWYGEFGFARACQGAQEYLTTLSTAWWSGHDAAISRRRAARFAGWYFCAPEWHRDYAFLDDANQDAIWWDLDRFLMTHHAQLEREALLLREWAEAGDRYFHIFKMSRAGGVK
jgi:hypothetical protein